MDDWASSEYLRWSEQIDLDVTKEVTMDFHPQDHRTPGKQCGCDPHSFRCLCLVVKKLDTPMISLWSQIFGTCWTRCDMAAGYGAGAPARDPWALTPPSLRLLITAIMSMTLPFQWWPSYLYSFKSGTPCYGWRWVSWSTPRHSRHSWRNWGWCHDILTDEEIDYASNELLQGRSEC